MPITTIRASGDDTYDAMTDLERSNEQNRQRVEDNLLRMHMQDRAQGEASRIAALQDAGATSRLGMSLGSAADIASMTDAGNTARFGLYGDRAAADVNMEGIKGRNELDRTNAMMQPALMGAEDKRREWESGAKARANADMLEGYRGSEMKRVFEPGVSAGQEVVYTPEEVKDMRAGLMGIARRPSASQKADELIRSGLSNVYTQAVEAGDFKKAERIRSALSQDKVGPLEGIGESLEYKVREQNKVVDVIEKSPVISMKVSQLINKAKAVAGSTFYATGDEYASIKTLMDDAIRSATDMGVNPEMAKQVILKKLDEAVPGGAWWNSSIKGSIRSTVGLPE